MLLRSAASEAGASSTKSADAAPRDSASSPSAPLPAKRSATRAPSSACPRMLIHASRTRSAVGRTRPSFGTANRRPPKAPATILTRSPARVWRMGAERAEPGLQRRLPLPLVSLQAEGRVHRPAAQRRRAIGPLESDGRELRFALLQHALEMPVTHDGPPRELDVSHAQYRRRIARAARLKVAREALQLWRHLVE